MKDDDLVEMSAANLQALATVLQKTGSKVMIDEKTNMVQVIFPQGTAKLDELNRYCFEQGVVLTHLILKKKKTGSKVNQQWLHDHINDPYVKMAQRDGYRARAAYKLQEIDETFKLIRPGDLVVDLGCAS
jgi:predicted rRNA methylase YqxC with S4 and FtsJ domains